MQRLQQGLVPQNIRGRAVRRGYRCRQLQGLPDDRHGLGGKGLRAQGGMIAMAS